MKSLFGFSLEALDQTSQTARNGVENPADIADAIREGLILKYKDTFLCAPITESKVVFDTEADDPEGDSFGRMQEWTYHLSRLTKLSLIATKKSPRVIEAEPAVREFGTPEVAYLAPGYVVGVGVGLEAGETFDTTDGDAAEAPYEEPEAEPAVEEEEVENPTPTPVVEAPKSTKVRLEIPKCFEALRETFDDMLACGTQMTLIRQIMARGAGAIEMQREQMYIDTVMRYWDSVKNAELTVADTIIKLNSRLDKDLAGTADPRIQKLVEDMMEKAPSGMRRRLREQLDGWLKRGMQNTLRHAWDQAFEQGSTYPIKYTTAIMEQEEKLLDIEAVRNAAKMTPDEIREVCQPFMPLTRWDREARLEECVVEFSKGGVIDVGTFMRIAYDPGSHGCLHELPKWDVIEEEMRRNGYKEDARSDYRAYQNLAGNFHNFWRALANAYAERGRSAKVRTIVEMQAVLDTAIKNFFCWVRDGKTKMCKTQCLMDEIHLSRVVPYMLLNSNLAPAIRWWMDNQKDEAINVEDTLDLAEALAERYKIEFTR